MAGEAMCRKFAGAEGTLGDGSRTYVIPYSLRNISSLAAAEIWVSGSAPTSYNGAPRKSWRIRETSPKTYDVEVFYSSSTTARPEVGVTNISGRFTRDTITTTHALNHIGTHSAPGKIPGDFKGAINVTDDGVGGIELPAKATSFSITKAFAPGTITDAYLDTLELTAQCVNHAAWGRWRKGEVLLEDASYEIESERETVTLDISISKSIVDEFTMPRAGGPGSITIPVGSDPEVPGFGVAKEGWHYMWFEYAVGEANAKKTETLIAVHIEQVFEYANFSLLGF